MFLIEKKGGGIPIFWQCLAFPFLKTKYKLWNSYMLVIFRGIPLIYGIANMIVLSSFNGISDKNAHTVVRYTADFGHSGPRLAIANCGHSGNCTLRHWIRSHDRAQYGSCTLGLVWQLPMWIRMAWHIGTCHSGHSWQLSLGPKVAATWLFMVIYYFFIFYTKMRRLDGSRVVPSIIPAPLLLRWYGDVQLVSFFSFLSLLSKLFILEQLFSRWFHVVPVVFGSFMLTCYLEPSWFPFF